MKIQSPRLAPKARGVLWLCALMFITTGCDLIEELPAPEITFPTVENEVDCAVNKFGGDGRDNDRDGIIDEGCACPYEGKDVGVCSNGFVNAQTGMCARPKDYYPIEITRCDGRDNDCDGQTNEKCPCSFSDKGAGVCQLGRVNAAGTCIEPGLYREDEDKTRDCDGYDNDCDASTDEGCPICNYQQSRAGVCAYGRYVKGDPANGIADECLPPLNYAQDEDDCATNPFAWDGVDNDCDGIIDEGCACNYGDDKFPRGVCIFGRLDQKQLGLCLPPLNYEQEETLCDEEDNDCDGEVDEGCEAGSVTRSTYCPLGDPDCDPMAFCEGSDCPDSAKAMALGLEHTCVIDDRDQIVCWGSTAWDKLNAPQGKYTQITAGDEHTCALRENGNIRCWGRSDSNQTTAPIGLFTQVAAGGNHTCGLDTSGAITCWGNDDFSQLDMIPQGSGFTQIAAGARHTCALDQTGKAVCWGRDERGSITPPSDTFTSISLGNDFSCGLKEEGGVICWGRDRFKVGKTPFNDFESLSIKSDTACGVRKNQFGDTVCWGDVNFNQDIFTSRRTFKSVYAAQNHVCGIDTQSSIYCWGDNSQLQVKKTSRTFDKVATGETFRCGLQPDGGVLCWGARSRGQLSIPTAKFTDIGVGKSHACGLTTESKILCWGDDVEGQREGIPQEANFTQISVGQNHSCALNTSNNIVCWGNNEFKQNDTPANIQFKSVRAGVDFTCGVTMENGLSCWGRDTEGRLQTPPGEFAEIAPGTAHTCARQETTNIVQCWGRNKERQANPPTTTAFKQLALGSAASCGLTQTDVVECWGEKTEGGAPPGGEFKDIDAAEGITCGTRPDGSPACW